MATRYELPVRIKSRNNHDLAETVGALNAVDWTKQERIKNALKTLGMYFAFMCFAVLMPVIHYFLVPTLFIVMFVMAMDKYTQLSFNEGGRGACPKCGESLVIEKSKFKERLTDSCGKCHEDVEILVGAVVRN